MRRRRDEVEKSSGRALKNGDKVGITAPAGPVKEEQLLLAVSVVEEMGFQVEIGLTCYEEYGGYLAGRPEFRANELNWMFANRDTHCHFLCPWRIRLPTASAFARLRAYCSKP